MLGINLGKPESKMNQVLQRSTKISKRIFHYIQSKRNECKGTARGCGAAGRCSDDKVSRRAWSGCWGLGLSKSGRWPAAVREPLLQSALLPQPAATWGTRLNSLSQTHPTSEN